MPFSIKDILPFRWRVRRLKLFTHHRYHLWRSFMQVTNISLQAGAAPVHYVVADQNGNPLLPANVTWVLDQALAGLVMSSDATGFFFSCPAATPAETGNATATYTGPGAAGGSVSQAWPCTVTIEAVTGLTLLQQ
jgi:hypothetical protein